MTGVDIVPVMVSWVLIAVPGVATVAGLKGLNREGPTRSE